MKEFANIMMPGFVKTAYKVERIDSDRYVAYFKAQGEDVVIEYIRKLNGWRPALDINVNGVSWMYNNVIGDDQAPELSTAVACFNMLQNRHHETSDAAHEAKRERNIELVDILLEGKHA